MNGTEMLRAKRVLIHLNSLPDADSPNIRPTKSYLFYLSQRFVFNEAGSNKADELESVVTSTNSELNADPSNDGREYEQALTRKYWGLCKSR